MTNTIYELALKRKILLFNVSLFLTAFGSLFFAYLVLKTNTAQFYFNLGLGFITLSFYLINKKTHYQYFKPIVYLFFVVLYIEFTTTIILNPADNFRLIWYFLFILSAFLLGDNPMGVVWSIVVVVSIAVLDALGYLVGLSSSLPTIYPALLMIIAISIFINNSIKASVNILNDDNIALDELVRGRTKELEDALYIDPTTQLPNRNSLYRYILEYKPRALVIFDIKNFASINDTFSIVVGDEILKIVAKRLLKLEDAEHKLFRLDSDRFVVTSAHDKATFATKKITAILDEFEQHPLKVEVANIEQEFSISVFAALSFEELSFLLESAGLALKYAKQNGLSYVEYSTSLHLLEKTKNSINNLTLIKSAIKENRVVPIYQKIEHQEHKYYEALVRIREGERLLTPDAFLEDAKKTSYYDTITKTMIEKTFEYFKHSDAKFSLNLSFKDIAQKELSAFIYAKLKHFNKPHNVIFEILESENVSNPELVRSFNKQIKKYGAKLAIDDFGSGYSNFHYLAELEPDIVKIDGSIIRHIATNERYRLIAKNIVSFCHDIDIMVVGEYVFDKKTYDTAKLIGVDAFQGYHIAEPKTEVEI